MQLGASLLPEAGGRAIYTDLDPESIFGAATGPRSIPGAEVPTSTRPVDRRVKSGRKRKAIYTGTSSTGKTTLAERVVTDRRCSPHMTSFITANARDLIVELGHRSVDDPSPEELRLLQYAYLLRKMARESAANGYVTDRSFVDVAAYWIEYTKCSLSAPSDFLTVCRREASRYDFHFYFPAGVIPFKHDGYRSADESVHTRIDDLIKELLHTWNISAVTIPCADLDARVTFIADVVGAT